jgi:dihydropteroate synthase
MNRRRFEWKIRSRTLFLGERTLIMGVLNVTPDSFSDGGKFADPDRAFARAIELEELGVDIIDIGAESTRPGSQRISEAEELRRLIPVLKRLNGKLNVPISVDTYKAGVAVKALEYGVDIINDPSGLTFDVQLARSAANGDAGLILNHMRGTPEMWSKLGPLKDVAGTVITELDAAINRARRNGVDPKRIVVDPGLGFGKRREQNSELIARLGELERLDRPIMVGPSRKQFLAQEDAAGKEFATAAAVAGCILNGAHIVRVHDIVSMSAAIQVADAIVASRPEPKVEETPKPRRAMEGGPREGPSRSRSEARGPRR